MIYTDKVVANIASLCKELELTVMSKNRGDSTVVYGVEKAGFPFDIGFNIANQMYYITLEGGKYKTCPDLDYFKDAVKEHIYVRTNLVPNCVLVSELFSGVYNAEFTLSGIEVETLEDSSCIFKTRDPSLELVVSKSGVIFHAVLSKLEGLRRRRRELMLFEYRLVAGNIVQRVTVDYICHVHKNKTTKVSATEFKVDQWVIKIKEIGDDTYLSTEGLQDVHIDGVTFNINNFDHIENWLLGELEEENVKKEEVKQDTIQEMGYEDVMEHLEAQKVQETPQTASETMDAVNDAVDNVGSMLEKALDTVKNTIDVLKAPTSKPDEVQDAIEQLDEVHVEIEQLQQQGITVEESKQVQEVVTAIEEAKNEVQMESEEPSSNIIRDVFSLGEVFEKETKTPADLLREELESLDDVHEKYDIRSQLSRLDIEEPKQDNLEGVENMTDLVAIYNIRDTKGAITKVRFEFNRAYYDVPVELAKEQGLPVDLIIDSLELVNIRGLMMTEQEHHSRVFAKQITDTQATKVLIESFFK